MNEKEIDEYMARSKELLAAHGQSVDDYIRMVKVQPSGVSPGSPAGSYALSGFENVNLFNGNLNFRLPLLGISGRGSAGYSMTLALNLKSWHVSHFHKVMPDESEID